MSGPALAAIAREVGRHRHRWSQIRSLAASFFPLSITARLILSFAAVTVLAATANLIAQKSVSVIRFAYRADSVAITLPAITLPTLPPPPVELPALEPLQAPKVPAVDHRQAEALTVQIDLLERAGEARATVHTEATDEQFRAALRTLRHTAETIGHGAGAAAPAAAAVVRGAVEYADDGSELVSLADERRTARTDYTGRSEAIGARTQAALDAAWKIFGRVIARQSLLQLRNDFDSLSRSSTGLNAGEVLSAAQLAPIIERERAFEATLTANRAAFVKAQGLAWVEGVNEDFRALVDLRQRIVALNARCDVAQSHFSRARLELSSALQTASTTLQTSPVAARPHAAAAVVSRMTAHTAAVPDAVPAAIPDASAPRETTAPNRSSPPPPSPASADDDLGSETRGLDHRSRSIMAAVTAAVMLIIAVISILTVHSVLAPVRRIIKAAGRLAEGETRVKVARGGIRELDALAETFNGMAEKLAAAREANRHHQANLESKVVERTHQLQQLAQEDPLTSLPNRRHLRALLDATLDRAARTGACVGVYFIDVDNFKNFNDSLGHAFGDRMLMSIANRLEEATEGHGYVARLGGDEFTFIYDGADSVEAIHRMGASLIQAFHTLVGVDDHDLRISVSVGASIFPHHERNAEGLLRAADSALFRAKELGRNQLAVFTPELTASAATRFTTEQGLRRALERGEFELLYQPEINLATLEVELVECLLRWRAPDGRLVSPNEFLAIAEQSGLITDINAWVVHEAVQSAARWHAGGWPDARVAINISSRQLLDHGFIEQLEGLLADFALPHRCVELELTETVLQTGPKTVAALHALRERGFGIALDDFGTGYSSLTSLEQLPLSRIKLDRSLVESVDRSPRAAAIVRAILDLCAGLELAVTAEGIERPQQLAWLAANRDLHVQGYLLSKGLVFDDVLAARTRLTGVVQDLLLSTPIPARGPADVDESRAKASA